MQFKENQTIYLQIAERISDEILLGHYAIGARIPSVREYAALVEVNANTVMRSYEFLQTQGIIFNKRGIGFFVSPDAKHKITGIPAKRIPQDRTATLLHAALYPAHPHGRD